MALAVSARMTFVMLAQVRWHNKVSTTRTRVCSSPFFMPKKCRSAFCFACGVGVWTGLTMGFRVVRPSSGWATQKSLVNMFQDVISGPQSIQTPIIMITISSYMFEKCNLYDHVSILPCSCSVGYGFMQSPWSPTFSRDI